MFSYMLPKLLMVICNRFWVAPSVERSVLMVAKSSIQCGNRSLSAGDSRQIISVNTQSSGRRIGQD